MPSPFSRLIDDLARERDRRASARETAMLVERIRHGGRPFHKAIAGITAQLETMAKSMSANVARARATDKESAFERLAAISAKGNELAAAGKLTGEEGAYLDIVIAHTADRIRAL